MFTTANHLSLKWARRSQSTSFHPVFLTSTSSHLRLGRPSGLFLTGFQTKTLYVFLFSSHTCHVIRPSHLPSSDHPNNTWWGTQAIELLIMQSSPALCHLFPASSTYFPHDRTPTPSAYVLPLMWETEHGQGLIMAFSCQDYGITTKAPSNKSILVPLLFTQNKYTSRAEQNS